MPAEDIAFEKGTGPEQLPAGAATEVNAQLPTQTASQPDPMEGAALPEQAPVEEDVPVAPAEAGDFDADYMPADEDDEFLTGPTGRPGEDQAVGTAPRRGLSPRLAKNMTLLQQASSAPGASPELQALVSYLLRNA